MPSGLKRDGECRYRITMREFYAKVHRDMKPTRFWGYDGLMPGPTIEAESGKPLVVEWVNALPRQHFLPVDHTVHGAEKHLPDARTVVHLHGGRTSPESDGYPERWFTPGKSAICRYANGQDAAALFYHDHAMGITRLNCLAGLVGVFVIRDSYERSLNLPAGAYEIPLVFFDRSFDLDHQLAYPVSGNPEAPWVSDFIGDALLVNGRLFPFLEVEPRPYRFRMLNFSNGAVYRLSLSQDKYPLTPGGEPFTQIGTDQGLLTTPLNSQALMLSPAERADVVIDFSGWAGRDLFLKNGVMAFLQFRVKGNGAARKIVLSGHLRRVEPITESSAVKTRILSLSAEVDSAGRQTRMLLNGTPWHMPVTEKPVLGAVEIWTFVNTTQDTHPMHLHMVRFQILDRRPFDVERYNKTGELIFTEAPTPPAPNETGWKDTVRADPLMATRIIVRFEGFTGRYVWHCHILEHEDNEMMRPYEIIERSTA